VRETRERGRRVPSALLAVLWDMGIPQGAEAGKDRGRGGWEGVREVE